MSIRVMIVEDDQQLAELISGFFVRKNETEIARIACNSLEAIEMLKVWHPDVVILDLVMPHSDGFVFLEHLYTVRDENKPEIIVLSSLSHESIIKRACELGAIYYMVKPFSLEDLHKRVVGIAGLKNSREQTKSHIIEKSIDQCLSEILTKFGIPTKNRGYKYICEAVKTVIVEPEMIEGITKQLYPSIARMFNSSPVNVESAIRRAIEVACDGERLQNTDKITSTNSNSLRYRPSNGEFISLVSSEVWNLISGKSESP